VSLCAKDIFITVLVSQSRTPPVFQFFVSQIQNLDDAIFIDKVSYKKKSHPYINGR